MKIRTGGRIVLISAALAMVCSGCAREASHSGFDWPRWRGANGDGISVETQWNPMALAAGPRVLWKVDVGIGYSNVAIQANRLYTMGSKNNKPVVQCLRADTGRAIWQFSLKDGADPQATPTIADTSVYALSKEGLLLCLDSRNGRLRWKKDLVVEYGAVKPTHGFAGPPVVKGDLLLLTVNSAGLALNRETGELVWDSPVPPPPAKLLKLGASDTTGTNYPSPVLYEHTGKSCALFSGWEGIISVEIETGKPALLYAWEIYSGIDVPDPVVSGDKVLVSSCRSKHAEWAGVLLQVEGESSKVAWKSPHLYSNITTPVIVAGYIYAGFGGPGDGRADLRCVELQTGKLQWVNKASEGGTTACVSLTAANGKLIVLNSKGWLYIAEASPAGFNVLSSGDVFKGEQRVRQFWTPPVLCNGRIYCRNFSGELLCIDVAI